MPSCTLVVPVSEQSGNERNLGPLPGGHHGLSREQVAESQRERLLAAVAQLVAETGYRKATITSIVKAASVSSRVFYEQFESKEDAFLASFDAVFDYFEDLVGEATREESDWPGQVVAALRASVSFFAAEPDLARAFLVEPASSTPRIVERFREATQTAVPPLERGRAERPSGSELPESTEEAILGGLIALVSRSIQSEADPAETLPALVEFALAPYLGAEEARRRAAETAHLVS